jgi:hypothetical protein
MEEAVKFADSSWPEAIELIKISIEKEGRT